MRRSDDSLDRTDFAVLAHLQNNARMMNKQLAAAVGLAASSVHERVKRLMAMGVIRGAHLDLDHRRLGYGVTAVIFLTISREGALAIDPLVEDLAAIPGVQDVYLITGQYDLVLTVVARDMDDLKALAYRHLTGSPLISRYETSIAYDHRRCCGISGLGAQGEADPWRETGAGRDR